MGEQLDYAMTQGDTGFILGFILINLFLLGIGIGIIYYIIYLFKVFNKKTVLIILLLIGAFVAVSGQTISLKKIDNRPHTNVVLSLDLKSKIRQETAGKDADEIINYSTKLTAKLLYFSKSNGSLGTLHKTSANCVGYAKLGSAICNYAFTVNNIHLKAKPVVGYVYLDGINICKICSNIFSGKLAAFTKDHDFIEIENVYYIDPCAYDLIGSSLRHNLN